MTDYTSSGNEIEHLTELPKSGDKEIDNDRKEVLNGLLSLVKISDNNDNVENQDGSMWRQTLISNTVS